MDDTLPIRLTFVLAPRDEAALDAKVADVLDPSSANYHQFLELSDAKAQFAPQDEDVDALVKWATASGLRVVNRSPTNLAVILESDVKTVQSRLGVHLDEYELDGRHFFSHDAAPTLPAELASKVRDVLGLESFASFRGSMHANERAPDAPAPRVAPGPYRAETSDSADVPRFRPEVTGPQAAFGIEPPDLYTSFGYDYAALARLSHCCNPTGAKGGSPRETSIAIVGSNKPLRSDYQTFFKTYGLAWNVTEIGLGGPSCCDDEMTLDIEYSVSMSNSFGASNDTAHVYMYEAGGTSINDLYGAWLGALEDNRARVLSTSFGAAEHQYGGWFNEGIGDFTFITRIMSLVGWTLVAASGDDGATADSTTISIQYPASDPLVVAVGGTQLNLGLNGTGQLTYLSEGAWQGSGVNNGGGGGGGCSSVFGRPAWQAPLQGDDVACVEVSEQPNSPTHPRMIPDISLNAGGSQVFYYSFPPKGTAPGFQSVGGTSIAAPEIAGFFAQANSYLAFMGYQGIACGANQNRPCAPFGPAGPALYAPASSRPHNPYYDITTGCNDGVGTFGYCAGPGYDLATGFGSANMLQLAWALNTFENANGTEPPVVTFAPSVEPSATTLLAENPIVFFTITESGRSVGIAGFTARWDVDPGDPTSHATPGSGDPFYDGPENLFVHFGEADLSKQGPGCHTLYVRAWNNDGLGGSGSIGPFCYGGCEHTGDTFGSDGVACGTQCCGAGNACVDGACCPAAQACGDTCCAAGTACFNGFCGTCGAGTEACQYLAGAPVLCCAAGALCSPTQCCEAGWIPASDGTCYQIK